MRDPFADDDDPIEAEGSPVALLTATNDEATICRYSAHAAGLINDLLVEHFLPPHQHQPHFQQRLRRDPLIDRGTYLRVRCIDQILGDLLEAGPLQVVSLGAGFDTRFFRFHVQRLGYVEVDFEEVIERKQHVIAQHRLPPPAFIAADLEMNFSQSTLPRLLTHLNEDMKTLVIAECCLMYLRDETVRAILRDLSTIPGVHLAVFDPLHLGDPFGRTMAHNLSALPIQASLERYPTPTQYCRRVEQCGWKDVSMESMWQYATKPEHRDWMTKKAPLDEYEQWEIITKHYFILRAHN